MNVKIGPHTYAIRENNGPILHNGSPCNGLFDPETTTIHVNVAVADSVIAETLLHETLHAIYAHYVTMDGSVPDEEALVSVLGFGLSATISDNPEFFTIIQNLLLTRDSE